MGGWANTLSFSPSGEALMFSSKFSHILCDPFAIAHDSIMHYYEIGKEHVYPPTRPEKGQKFSTNGSPILCGTFISENAYIGSGWDKSPILFKKDAKGEWAFVKYLDQGIKNVRPSAIGNNAFGGKTVFFDGMSLQNDVEVTDKETKHVNLINCQKRHSGAPDKVETIVTSDVNGYLHTWKVGDLC